MLWLVNIVDLEDIFDSLPEFYLLVYYVLEVLDYMLEAIKIY